MIAQWENKVMSSMLLFLDNQICDKGQGYTNVTNQEAYLIDSNYSQLTFNLANHNLYAYALPFKQIIIDESVTGANICKTVQVSQDGAHYSTWSPSFPGPNTELNCILHHKGQFLFDENIADLGYTNVRATCAVKDFNIYISSKFEEDLLINTKYQVNPKINQTLAGLPDNTETYPAIFLKNMGGTNQPLTIGTRTQNVKTKVRAVVMADSAFNLDAVCNILKNTCYLDLPILESNNLPFNSIGGYRGVIYDYSIESAAATEQATIWDVNVTRLNPNSSELRNLHAEVHSAFVDFEVHGVGKNT
tara:strand:+ start:320 stop:1231 length:912 start_codon:yes stop_codon:yes gene_type:complete